MPRFRDIAGTAGRTPELMTMDLMDFITALLTYDEPR
jgi:hypothetical protein